MDAMKLLRGVCVLVLLTCVCGAMAKSVESQYGPRLVGIYNNLTKASNSPSLYAPAVSIRNTVYANVIGKPFFIKKSLPITIEIKFHDTIRPEAYVLTIGRDPSAGDCPGTTMRLTAKVEGFEGSVEASRSVCSSRAINAYMYGRETFEWQNVMLLLADNPNYVSMAGSLPFKFELCSWTSTRPPWDKTTIYHPSDNNRITFETPLQVVQGLHTWGSTVVPRMGFSHIMHVYNDSDCILYMTREGQDAVSSQYNFIQMVPPHAVMPFAMVFIPKVGNDAYSQRGGIRIFAMQSPKTGTQLPPSGFTELTTAGTYEIAPTVPDVESAVEEMLKKQERDAANILGIPSLDNMLANKYNRYFIGESYYNVINVDDKIIIQQCNTKTGDCQDVSSVSVKKSNVPVFFKLTTQPAAQTGFGLRLEAVPDEKPF